MCTGHTSTPSRWRGKTAALLPTWPYATEDWIDKMLTGAFNQSSHPRPRTRPSAHEDSHRPDGRNIGHGVGVGVV
ncbi:hypothetical protein GCM10009867_08630 [Pedococcus aerophilus]|uniref:Uncharacterized protein n=1 Tax=Pedococcus aerophilus TaxID=436356 RepID=A0ABN3UGV3_9MICO